MTTAKSITLTHFRNITDLSVSLNPGFNFLYGENGAGKTSFLESFYYLSHGRSFRASNYQKIIQHDKTHFLIYVELNNNGKPINIGFERDRQGARRIKINNAPSSSISEMVSHLPVVFLSSLSYQFFTEGPKARCQFVDWLTFHVKPSFYGAWRQTQNILKQRNSALKQKRSRQEVFMWDKELSFLSEQLDTLRQDVVLSLAPYLSKYAGALLPNSQLVLSYERGWDAGKDLEKILAENISRDSRLGYTTAGPHRADFKLLVRDHFAGDVLSQGQQKVAIFALQLAMGDLFSEKKQSRPIYLLDDLASELDPKNRKRVVSELADSGAQVLVTGIVLDELKGAIDDVNASVFHVKHGSIENHQPAACESGVS